MNQVQKYSYNLVESSLFRYFILFLIIASGVIVGLETYPSVNMQYSDLFFVIDKVIIYIFLIEIILKMLAKGSKPWEYFYDPWNVFDFIIVTVCFIPGVDTHFVAIMKSKTFQGS